MANTSNDNPALAALDRLQASVRERNVDLERWERANAAERAACGPGAADESVCEREGVEDKGVEDSGEGIRTPDTADMSRLL